jgi:glutaredoxin 3
MYTKPHCPYCVRARSLLSEKGVTYREIDISGNAPEREEMIRRSGRRTVPQIFIGDHHVGGFDDLSALERSGKLDPLLNIGS